MILNLAGRSAVEKISHAVRRQKSFQSVNEQDRNPRGLAQNSKNIGCSNVSTPGRPNIDAFCASQQITRRDTPDKISDNSGEHVTAPLHAQLLGCSDCVTIEKHRKHPRLTRSLSIHALRRSKSAFHFPRRTRSRTRCSPDKTPSSGRHRSSHRLQPPSGRQRCADSGNQPRAEPTGLFDLPLSTPHSHT